MKSMAALLNRKLNSLGDLHLNATEAAAVIEAIKILEGAVFRISALGSGLPEFHNPDLTKACMDIEEAMAGDE